jgi:hypothetical protein
MRAATRQEDAIHATKEERKGKRTNLGPSRVLCTNTAWSTLHLQASYAVLLHHRSGATIHLSR